MAPFPCRLCGHDDLRLYYTLGNDGRFKYYKCRKCSLVNYDLTTGLDQTQYEASHLDPLDDSLKFNHDKDHSFEFLSQYVEPPGRLLDVGCGNGRLLYAAKRAGWQVKGLELSESMAEWVRQKLNIEVDVGNFLEMPSGGDDHGTYDAVVLHHVIEHLPDSLLAMEKISALLKPSGYLMLEMPNVEALTKKWSRFVVGIGLHTRSFEDDFIAGHCNEFSSQSTKFLARKSGFELIRWETYSKKPVVNWIYNRLPIGTKARALLRKR